VKRFAGAMADPTACSAGEGDRATMVCPGIVGTPGTPGTDGPDGAESLLREGRSIFRQGCVRIQIRFQIEGET
jgi:hypothetical protein